MTVLVTGGAGFIGSHLVRRLVREGESVWIYDDGSRGTDWGDANVIEYEEDIRDGDALAVAADGADEIIHLAYVNGTETFYKEPERVLEVGVKGIVNVLEACRACDIKKLTLVSSSEVCRAKLVGADETIPLVIPDPMNPRYSYSAGKIISEMMALHAPYLERVLICRPFNIYGPGMSRGHVVPDFVERLSKLADNTDERLRFDILGSGEETRSFCYIDDFIDGVMIMRKRGEHRGIYNIGRDHEITIEGLAYLIASLMNRNVKVFPGSGLREGDALRRKPDVRKLMQLGYAPEVNLRDGLRRTIASMLEVADGVS